MTRALPLVGVMYAALTSCTPYTPQPESEFHARFVWGPAHGPSLDQLGQDTGYDTQNFCDKCHIALADQQVTEQAVNLDGIAVAIDDPVNGWSTRPSPLCQSCHPIRWPFVDAGVTPQNLFCPPGAEASELCRFVNQGAHNGINIANGCDGFACHQTVNPTTWSLGGEDGGSGHDEGEVSVVFPLEGGHESLSCGEANCHADVSNPQADAGRSTYCSNCHGRGRGVSQPSDGIAHYPSYKVGWTGATPAEDAERDCRGCHSNFDEQADGKVLIPASFNVDNRTHDFGLPHRALLDFQDNPIPATPDAQVQRCITCHRQAITPPVDPQSNFFEAFGGFTGFYGPSDPNQPFANRSCDNCHNANQPAYTAAHSGNPGTCEECHPRGDGSTDDP